MIVLNAFSTTIAGIVTYKNVILYNVTPPKAAIFFWGVYWYTEFRGILRFVRTYVLPRTRCYGNMRINCSCPNSQ